MFNSFIKSCNVIEISSKDTSIAACYFSWNYFKIHFVCASPCNNAKYILHRDLEFEKQLVLKRIPTLFQMLFSTNSTWFF